MASVLAGLWIAIGCSPPGGALSAGEPARAAETFGGDEYFQRLCVSCHGEDARGSGAIAPLLKVEIPDLTTISLRNDGVFPEGEVWKKIDGTEEVLAHGPRTMPVWGVALNPLREESSEIGWDVAQDQIARIVEYLRTIQR